jgi:hypothetical protein
MEKVHVPLEMHCLNRESVISAALCIDHSLECAHLRSPRIEASEIATSTAVQMGEALTDGNVKD